MLEAVVALSAVLLLFASLALAVLAAITLLEEFGWKRKKKRL